MVMTMAQVNCVCVVDEFALRRAGARAAAPNASLFGVLMCLPTAPALPTGINEEFGASSF
jgi:hypothetical protein